MKSYKISFAAICLLVLIFTSCQKAKNTTGTADPNAKQHNEDVSNTKSESDNVNTDVNNILRELKGFGKNENAQAISICGATIDSSHQYDPIATVTITFDGTTACGNPARIRGGQIKVELIQGNKWGDAGSVLKVTHTNYKVTYVNLNNHYLIFNGVKYLTNLNALDYVGYYFTGNLTATIKERSDNMQVTFENGETESWNCARMNTYQLTGYTTATVTVNGDSLSGGKVIDSWGTTRFGTTFTTEMLTPWKSGTTCGWWRPTQGKYTSRTDNFTITATAGVDNNGNTVTSGCGAYGYKLEWDYQQGTASGDAVIQYF